MNTPAATNSCRPENFEVAKPFEPQLKKLSRACSLSEAAQQRMLAGRGEPLLLAHWDDVVFIHYEADPAALQECIPFPLDLFQGRAFVSVVAFTLRDMRPRRGGKVATWLMKPIATHEFFNVRTYVQKQDERAIYFMAEWLSNRLSVVLGPTTFGLPYRFGKIDYTHDGVGRKLCGTVRANAGAFQYQGSLGNKLAVCEPESVSEFLLERYSAFTSAGWRKQFFRVWHQPWQQCPIKLQIMADDLVAATGSWWATAEFVGANYAPGVSVWMGRPHFIATL